MAKKSEEGLVVSEQELSLVGSNLLNQDQLQFLLKKTPERHVYKRPAKGGGQWSYVTGSYVKKVLNLMFGWDWSFEVMKHEYDLIIGQVYVLGKLTVRAGDRDIVKMQFGRVDIKFKNEWVDGKKQATMNPLDLGNDLKAATTDALKKCAAELGVAADIYAPNEFKEISVLPENLDDEEKEKKIREILDEVFAELSQEDTMHIERILEDKEVKSYNKVLKKLSNLKK